MRSIFSCLLAAALALSVHLAASASPNTVFLSSFGEDVAGVKITAMARNLETGEVHVLEGGDVSARHSPWSTFKIPNLIIALETGTVPSLDVMREWDPAKRPAAGYWPEIWKQDQNLESAFRRSAVWYFQDLAQEIGADSYREYLSAWSYGNAEVPEGSDDFWLREPLHISVEEQVDFLDRLLSGELDVSGEAVTGFLAASREESFGDRVLHGKTGAGPVNANDFDGAFTGWYVGLVTMEGRPATVFAVHVQAPDFSALRSLRKAFAVSFLREIGALPAE